MDASLYLDRCLDQLQSAAEQLGGDASSPEWHPLANMIIQAMTGPWRSFHTPEHIFDVGANGSPVEIVAALFHDLVYVQVDNGINLNLSRYLAHYLRETPKGIVLETAAYADDTGLQLTLDIFGLQDGQVLNPFAGQNEFLSALVAVKSMQSLLPLGALARIAVCIEATIPFRTPAADGTTCCEQMLQRLEKTNARHGLGLSSDAIRQAVESAVRLANRDIGNFASAHPSVFLDNTWNLIPETNHDLVNVNIYTVRGFRIALQKMEGFLSQLNPELVFRRFDNEPDTSTHAHRLALTRRNLQVACMYLKVKLVSMGLLEALSLRIAPDVSLASMMGALPIHSEPSIQLEHLLPTVASPQQPANEHEAIVLELLQVGRSAESAHDSKHSPVSSFILKAMGFAQTLSMYDSAKAFFANPALAETLIEQLPAQVRHGLLKALHDLFTQRAQVFEEAEQAG